MRTFGHESYVIESALSDPKRFDTIVIEKMSLALEASNNSALVRAQQFSCNLYLDSIIELNIKI